MNKTVLIFLLKFFSRHEDMIQEQLFFHLKVISIINSCFFWDPS